MAKIKPFILPAALLLGLFLHTLAAHAAALVPYVIFTILLLNFSAVDLLKLPINKLDACIMAFQAIASIGGYFAIKAFLPDGLLAEGWLIAVLCPVASSVVVVAASIGADRKTTTGYTIYGNLLVAVVAPIYFTIIGNHPEMSVWQSGWQILCKTASVIALPYFLALAMQKALPKAKAGIGRLKEWAFPLWAFALFVTLGQTIDYIYKDYAGNEAKIAWLGAIAVAACALQFGLGKRIGSRYGETVAGGQMLGQKNTAVGIWMAVNYLNPLSSVALAFYSIAQNLFNSWQIWRYEHSRGKAQCPK